MEKEDNLKKSIPLQIDGQDSGRPQPVILLGLRAVLVAESLILEKRNIENLGSQKEFWVGSSSFKEGMESNPFGYQERIQFITRLATHRLKDSLKIQEAEEME